MVAQDLTASVIDEELSKLVSTLNLVDASQGTRVQLIEAELDLLEHMEKIRDFMTEALKDTKDRTVLLEIFGGDCSRIARIRAVCEAVIFSDKNAGDQRLKTCLSTCESVETVILDLGFADELKKAQEKEKQELQGEEDDIPDAVYGGLARCTMMQHEAVTLDEEGDINDALAKYEELQMQLTKTLGELSTHSKNALAFDMHRNQIGHRIQYLKGLRDTGKEAERKPVEEHITRKSTLIHSRDGLRKYAAACAAIGATGGLLLLGPAAALCCAFAGYTASSHNGKIGEVARDAADVAIDSAEAALFAANMKLKKNVNAETMQAAKDKMAAAKEQMTASALKATAQVADAMKAGYPAK